MTLTEFLLARIPEDEVRARGAFGGLWGVARVLAECEAKRRIVEFHDRDGDFCVGCKWEDDRGCPTLRALSIPYADHPDYRDEWKP